MASRIRVAMSVSPMWSSIMHALRIIAIGLTIGGSSFSYFGARAVRRLEDRDSRPRCWRCTRSRGRPPGRQSRRTRCRRTCCPRRSRRSPRGSSSATSSGRRCSSPTRRCRGNPSRCADLARQHAGRLADDVRLLADRHRLVAELLRVLERRACDVGWQAGRVKMRVETARSGPGRGELLELRVRRQRRADLRRAGRSTRSPPYSPSVFWRKITAFDLRAPRSPRRPTCG
jgi:hypothetical protein